MKVKLKRILILSIVCIMVFSTSIFGATTTNDNVFEESYLDSVIEMLLQKYNGEITKTQLYEGALKGLFEALDKYSIYYTEEDLQNFMESITGGYEGIGALLGQSEEYVIILKVFEDSPAENVGLLADDKIVSANGESLIGKTPEEAARLIKGVAGTIVELGILRGENEVFNINITRAKVEISPVIYSTFGNIGYIKLDTFASNADSYIQEALTFMDGKNISKVVLDLRNNPGGAVDQAVAIGRNFVPEGLITTLHFKDENTDDISYYSYTNGIKYELAVLVNENSASASELLSGAIQDSDGGTLIGTVTYGKGLVQNIFPILTPEAYKKYSEQLGVKITHGYDLMFNYSIYPSDNEILGWGKLTTGEYYTRNGRNIHGIGITPDILIDNYELVNGIDIWTINNFKKERKLTLRDEGTDVSNLERLLKLLGYAVDEPDLVYDQKTFNAISSFQKDMKLYPYGVCDFTTQNALNEIIIEKLYEIDTQFKTAIDILNLSN